MSYLMAFDTLFNPIARIDFAYAADKMMRSMNKGMRRQLNQQENEEDNQEFEFD